MPTSNNSFGTFRFGETSISLSASAVAISCGCCHDRQGKTPPGLKLPRQLWQRIPQGANMTKIRAISGCINFPVLAIPYNQSPLLWSPPKYCSTFARALSAIQCGVQQMHRTLFTYCSKQDNVKAPLSPWLQELSHLVDIEQCQQSLQHLLG
jgi:hypothetical protein